MTALASQAGLVDRSWLTDLDPRVKLWFALLGIGLCLTSGQLGVLIGVIAAAQIVLLAGGLKTHRLTLIWAALAPILLIIVFLQPVFVGGHEAVLWQIGRLTITRSGLLIGVRYALRVAGAAFVVLVPVLSTPVERLVRAFEKLGLPYAWSLTIGLALRYLGTLGDLYTTISEAQQARGWDLSQGRLLKRARAIIPTMVALIVASLRLSDGLALGLAARGFGASTARRTVLHDISMRPADWLAMSVTTAAYGGVIAILMIR